MWLFRLLLFCLLCCCYFVNGVVCCSVVVRLVFVFSFLVRGEREERGVGAVKSPLYSDTYLHVAMQLYFCIAIHIAMYVDSYICI